MIIKRNRAGQAPARPKESGSSGAHSMKKEYFTKPEPSMADWSEESIEAGLVDERRLNTQASDRRRGYRRIEEKNLISKAYEEANAILENAQREGFETGLQEAEAEIAKLRESIAELMNGREEALLSVADDIAALAVEVAQRVIKTEVSCDNSLVMSVVRDTIQKAGRNNKTILIKLHPDDTALVKKSLKDEPVPNLQAELIIMDDPTVDPGSCIIETNSGLIDASFSTQLGVLQQLFGTVKRDEKAGGLD
jgi:flagellar biosynthesis/type III secretory pathway protein FliH